MEPSRSADDIEAEGEGEDAGDSSESEWEYEYSTTETETYYLTVDLSIPDFAQLKDDAIIHNTRGGYKSWFNPMLEKPDITGVFENDDDDDDAARRRGRKDHAGATIHSKGRPPAGDGGGDPVRPSSKGKTWEDREEQQIQIMDLHTERPLVAHRGMVFTGTWANNIGTELIFTEPLDKEQEDQDDDDGEDEGGVEDGGSGTPHHDSDSGRPGSSTTSGARPGTKGRAGGTSTRRPLPYITALPGATLLAASSARLQCRPTTLTARSAPRRRHEAHRAARAANGFAIQVTDDRTGQRRPQARFLERLAALKRARGEADDVTVATVENPDDFVEDDSDEDFEREKKARKRGYEDGRKLRRARLQRINDGVDANLRRRRRRPDDRRGRRDGDGDGDGDEDGAEGDVGDVGSYVGLDGRWWFGATNPDSLEPLSPGATADGGDQTAEAGEGHVPSSPRKRRRLKPSEADAREEQGAEESRRAG
ncbi:hypothetical protein RB595_000384 [Gaeumannomyces hyphopodioides]